MSAIENTNTSSRLTPRKNGCLWFVWRGIRLILILFFSILIICLAAVVIEQILPDTPPDTSNKHVDGPYGVQVSKEQNTYLEVVTCNMAGSQACDYTIRLYYTKVGGWFQSTERVLILSQKYFSDSSKVQFDLSDSTRLPTIRIYFEGKLEVKRFFKFHPPATFQQAHSIKPLFIE